MKIGDSIVCIAKDDGVSKHLVIGNKYKIEAIDYNFNNTGKVIVWIYVREFVLYGVNALFFVNIKDIRKQKLIKIKELN
jgi:hypothetical protein